MPAAVTSARELWRFVARSQFGGRAQVKTTETFRLNGHFPQIYFCTKCCLRNVIVIIRVTVCK